MKIQFAIKYAVSIVGLKRIKTLTLSLHEYLSMHYQLHVSHSSQRVGVASGI